MLNFSLSILLRLNFLSKRLCLKICAISVILFHYIRGEMCSRRKIYRQKVRVPQKLTGLNLLCIYLLSVSLYVKSGGKRKNEMHITLIDRRE